MLYTETTYSHTSFSEPRFIRTFAEGRKISGANYKRKKISKSISASSFDILNIVVDYDITGQYLNLIEPDFPLSLSFLFYGTSKLTQNVFFHQVQMALNH